MKLHVAALAASLLLIRAAWAEPIELPFKATFDAAALDGAWTVRLSDGNTQKLDGGWLKFESAENSRAHVQRPLETDLVTVTAKMSGCASIELAWNKSRWCGVGTIAPTPFGRFYSTQSVGDSSSEKLHRGFDVNRDRWLRLQLGRACIRYQFSENGERWTTLRCIDRPAELAGAPSLVAVGKAYESGSNPFDENDTKSTGGKSAGGVAEVRIEPTPADALQMTSAERQALRDEGVDKASLALLAGDADPTFDAVARFYPPFQRPREVVGVADHPLEIGVNYLGQIDASPWAPSIAWLEIGEERLPFATEESSVERRLLDGYIPVLTLKTVRAGVRFEQTVLGWSEGMSPDKETIAFVRLRAIAREGAKSPTKLALVRRDGKRTESDMIATSADTSEAAFSFKFPTPASAVAVGPEEFEQKLSLVAGWWRDELKKAVRFDVPEPRVSEAYRAWIAYSMLNTDKKNGYLEPHDGSGFYEETFGSSAGLHSMAMDLYGLHDRAERVLATLLHFQQPDGLYTQNAGLPDHGAMLAALARHAQVTGDAEWLKKIAPQIVRAGDWVINQRKSAPKDGLTRGMIKFRPYCDYPDAVYNYFGDTWCCVGLESAAEALRSIGDHSNADHFAAEARQYRQDLLASMKSAAFRDGDMTILPLEPDTHRLEKVGHFRGGDYYGLTASSLLENEFLPADDERAVLITDMLEKRGGLIAGICEFMEGVDHAYTYGYLLTQLKRDDPRRAIVGFYGMLAFGMTRDTYSPVEVSMIATGENQATLPHLYSCTEQLRLLRNMLIREDGDALRIGQAIPRAWLESGKHVAVTDAPTTFGPVSFSITAGADGTMNVKIAPPTRRPPARIVVRLRHPQMKEIAEVTLPTGTAFDAAGDTITFSNLAAPIEAQVKFKTKKDQASK